MKEYVKNSTLTLMLIEGKTRVTIKDLEEYTTTGLELNTTHLIKESNTTKRNIHSRTPQPMIYSTHIILLRDPKQIKPGQFSFWIIQMASQEQSLNVTYCWAILGSQSQTRTDILGTGTAFDAQKQFLANTDDAINNPVDLHSQIAGYPNTLKYARSKIDFVYGTGLYMSPSNMKLRIGTIQDYNNNIVIANDVEELGLSLGLNNEANSAPTTPPNPTPPVQGNKTK